MKNAFYAQSGGVTAVINTTACGVLETARKHGVKVFAGKNGILGALNEELIDTSLLSDTQVAGLRQTPGGAFGSCRFKLKDININRREYERLIAVFKAHNIGYFFYNGGGDSQDTTNKISIISKELGYPLQCIGIPKTIDNDLPLTDNCPGFGSVAKYVAISILEASLDVASMAETSTKVFILEVMGRHAGWIAAAGALAKTHENAPPHIILFPEVMFDEEKFLSKIKQSVNTNGYCTIVASEGIKYATGKFLADSGIKDAFGHAQLGGVAPTLAKLIKNKLGYKYHWAVSDYLQRSARHISSKVDVEQAYALGTKAVEFALEGKTGILPVIVRLSNNPYIWDISEAQLSDVANVEKKMPSNYIDASGMMITEECRTYLEPLIQGEDYPTYKNGIPDYSILENPIIEKLLPKFI
ncbi:MAG: 6-phosphofructokinase [Francisellaceae bacterium]|jgi:ATP-dependent phosphofructokinase / diphosphate-dependent phosphofructokinase|nr:6-phosphofructokinase [Francisellaceae bacterium]MBT6207462.1 6-phosphofructokinase [Francisellaceae bacterium]MBT6539498.1 6-phosphofructokinase [Francisellaceae bacterium]